MTLLNGQGPKPRKGRAAKDGPARQNGMLPADRAAQKVLDARHHRRRAMASANMEVNRLAAEMWGSAIIAIDPGDVYCGVSTFTGGRCTSSQEMSPDQMLELVSQAASSGRVDVIVVENFVLYPDKAAEQAGSEMLTSQAIGALKWIVRSHNSQIEQWVQLTGGDVTGSTVELIELVLQPASIKTPTKTVLRHEGIPRVSPRTSGDHAFDSEVHGQHFILRGQGKIRGSENNRAVV